MLVVVAEQLLFGDRLHSLLELTGETQAWLADRSGLDRSLVSRLIKNDRLPTGDALRSLAPVLGIDLAEFVRGTNAEHRLDDAATAVRRADYEEALGTIIDFERKNRDLEARIRTLTETVKIEQLARQRAEKAAGQVDSLQGQLAALRTESDAKSVEIVRYQHALGRAVAQFGALQRQLDDVRTELGESKSSARMASVLAGIAAVTGAASLAHFLSDDPEPQRATRRSKTKAKRRKQG